MTITLYLEHMGVIIDDVRIPYEMKEETARRWRNMHPGKELTIYYLVGSKINYQTTEYLEQQFTNENNESTNSRTNVA